MPEFSTGNPLRGRPPKVDKETIVSAILNYREKILKPNRKPVSKLDPVWKSISRDLNNLISDRTLYSFVADDKEGIKAKITGTDDGRNSPHNENDVKNVMHVPNDSPRQNSSLDLSNDSTLSAAEIFTVLLPKEKYTNLLIEKSGKRHEKTKTKTRTYERQYTSLKPGLWQDLVIDTLWHQKRIGCGFNFHVPKICKDGNTGSISGSCKCESTISINIIGHDKNEDFVKMECRYRKGQGTCGKRLLRQPHREAVAKELCSKSAVIYRAEQANLMMEPGDSEPPHLYKTSVLNTAKKEYMMNQFYDPDPLKSLAIMKYKDLQQIIQSIGLDPFFIHYWTNHQLHIYRSFTRKHVATVSIDATGGVVKRLQKPDNTKSKHIFLYQVVINGDLGQFSVSQMMSESQDTVAITFWLQMWVKSGAPQPKEVICDSSKALLNAVVTAFGQHYTVEEYAKACSGSVLPRCYVRIDVAHFIKMYANLLRGVSKRVRVMYLAAMGQLITARDLQRAAELLKSILTIARSPTEGNLPCGRPTACEVQKKLLRVYITEDESLDSEGKASEDDALQCDASSQTQNIFDDTEYSNWWQTWGDRIDSDVKKTCLARGDRDNAHYMPKFAERLLKDIRWMPLWSCVCRDKFGYGRVPASSASVESDFNLIKTHLLQGHNTPMRVDEFVEKHVNYLNGRMKIADAKDQNDAPDNELQCSTASSVEQVSSEYSAGLTCCICTSTVSPTGSQVCELCLNTVHGTIPCSVPVGSDEEINNRQRLCTLCKDIDVKPILAAREEENWRGLTTKLKKKSSRYLQKNQQILDTLLLPTSAQIPILKNGRNQLLKAAKIGKLEVSLQYTCAFDSLVQVILACIIDRPDLKNELRMSSDAVFKLALHMAENGISAHTYRMRTNILLNRYRKLTGGKDIPEEGNYLLDCRVNVGALAMSLLEDTPSFTEISKCSISGCYELEKRIKVLSITPKELKNSDFENFLQPRMALPSRPCKEKGCLGTVNTCLTKLENLIFIEVNDTFELNDSIELRKIPQQFKNPLAAEMYQLVGVVIFHEAKSTRSAKTALEPTSSTAIDSVPLGHYTAACLRSSKLWIEYDDFREKSTTLNEKHRVTWHLLIFAKQ